MNYNRDLLNRLMLSRLGRPLHVRQDSGPCPILPLSVIATTNPTAKRARGTFGFY